MSGTRCPDCGNFYKNTGEILKNGGSCKQIGLALFGVCSCGGDLGGISNLWRPAKQNSGNQDKQAQQVKTAMLD